MVQNLRVSSDVEEQSGVIHIEFIRLRRSGRASSSKRTYEHMQYAKSTSSRPAKKHKCTVDEASTGGDRKKVFGIDESVDEPASNKPASDDPTTRSDTTSEASKFLEPYEADVLTSATNTQMETSDIITVFPDGCMPPMTHVDGLAILDEYFEQPVISAGPADDTASLVNYPMNSGESRVESRALEVTVDFNATRSESFLQAVEKNTVTGNESTPDLIATSADISAPGLEKGPSEAGSLFTDPTSTASSAAHINNNLLASDLQQSTLLNRAVLDESAQWLEAVSMALEKAVDVSRKPRNSVLERMDFMFTGSEFDQCTKIMTAVAENVVRRTRCMAKPELDAGQEQSRDRNQTTSHSRRLTTGNVLQHQKQSQYSHDNCLGKRDRIQIELQRILSEPDELMGNFREDSDYETALKQIEKNNADDTRNRLRQSWKETFYWPMIQRRAKMIGPLPKSSGRKTEITPQEKSAAKKLIHALGYGQSRDNVFKWTLY